MEGLEGVPLRGPYGKSPLSIQEQFSYLDDTDLDAALAGRLNPNRLHRLLHPQSPWFVGSAHEDESTTVLTASGFMTKSNTSIADGMFRKLCKGLPTPTHFLVAWQTLISLMTWDADTEGARQIIRAMTWYGHHLVELSSGHTWESCLRVFVDHAKPRLLGKFSVTHWYEAANASQQQKLLVAKPSPSRPTGHTSGRPAPPSLSSNPAKHKDVCRNYNTQGKGCGGCSRVHGCDICRKKHPSFECPEKGKMH